MNQIERIIVPYEDGEWVAASDYDNLLAERERDRRDAERYRWLRDKAGNTSYGPCIYGGYLSMDSGLSLREGLEADEAIDAAMAQNEPAITFPDNFPSGA